jgi:gamma-glutamyl:cysteine ligase YbdK (ATP-grasp superfamily)
MDAWQELERLASMAAMLQARLSRAAEYGDDEEASRIRIELMKFAEKRERAVARLGAEIDAVNASRVAV